MGNFISLKSDDGHELDAYLSLPKNPINASLVIVQEIFGVNEHIKNVSDYYSIAHLFVLPSFHEGFGVAIIEAMAHSVPVISTKVSGIKDSRLAFTKTNG